MCFPTDRVALALVEDPRVERLLICNQPRSAPIKLVKDALRRAGAVSRRRPRPPLRAAAAAPARPDLDRRPGALLRAYGRRLRRAAGAARADAARRSSRPTPSSPPSPSSSGPGRSPCSPPTTGPPTPPTSAGGRPTWPPTSESPPRAAGLRRDRDDHRPDRAAAGPPRWCPTASTPPSGCEIPPPPRVVHGAARPALPLRRHPRLAAGRRRRHGGRPRLAAGLDRPRRARSPIRRTWRRSRAEPNVPLPGPVRGARSAALVHAADACLVPHHRTAADRGDEPAEDLRVPGRGSPGGRDRPPPSAASRGRSAPRPPRRRLRRGRASALPQDR